MRKRLAAFAGTVRRIVGCFIMLYGSFRFAFSLPPIQPDSDGSWIGAFIGAWFAYLGAFLVVYKPNVSNDVSGRSAAE